ncbi:MAG: DUF2062 domain-containing protein [Thermodesulfobacteriota bacterium]
MKRVARYYYLKLLRLQGDPHSLAMGVAIGLLVGVTPTIPLHTVLILLLVGLVRSNLIAALFAATAISNPLTWLPQYYLCWRIGDWLLPGRLSWERIKEILALFAADTGLLETLAVLGRIGLEAILVMVVGGTLLALPIAAGGYLLALRFFIAVRHTRRRKHILD